MKSLPNSLFTKGKNKRYKTTGGTRNTGRGKTVSTILRIRFLFVALFLCLCTSHVVFAQMETAALSGVIQDPKGGVVPDVEVTATRIETGTAATTKTNGAGIYFFTGLIPGHYHLMVRKPGFKEIAIKDFQLYVQDKLEQNFSLEIGSISETVTVEAGGLTINTQDAAVSTVVDQTYIKNMPLNGRSFQDLILLTPGIVTNSPQQPSVTGDSGEFSVNGQRTESNYYTVDGVSGNIGVQPGFFGPGNSGSVAAATALGTTQALVSVDALEEFRVQTSTYSAEYGRNPGGQFSFVTRAGTNQWHGTAFDYLRNNYFDANNWFNNFFGQPEPPLRQNDFGGTVGGPITIPRLYNGKDKTFFFFSYEGLRATQPQASTINYVPDSALRQSAPSALQPVLNAFPTANGPDLGNGLAEFIGTWSNPSSLDAYSVRLDHSFNDKLKVFFRFSDTPSKSQVRLSDLTGATPSVVQAFGGTPRTYTFGATSVLSSRVGNEVRLNYSSLSSYSNLSVDSFAGGQSVSLAQLQQIGQSGGFSVAVSLGFGSQSPQLSEQHVLSTQRQWNFVDTIGVSLGSHQLKFGFDYRRLTPLISPATPQVNYNYSSIADVQANNPLDVLVINSVRAYPLYSNYSTFAQDDWRITHKLNLSMGLRWEVNPAPGVTQGLRPYTLEGIGNLSTMTLAPQGTPLWKTTWFNFAPRLGVAYVLRSEPDHETVVRGGGGLFFDTGQQVGSYGFGGVGLANFSLLGYGPGQPVSFPVPPADIPPPSSIPTPRYGTVYGYPTHLQLPYTIQWNVAVEQALGKAQTLSITYVGSHAGRLLEQKSIDASLVNPNFGFVELFLNGLTSDYDALQAQYQRRIERGLTAIASYTYGHSIDYGSKNFFFPYQRGNSDFDVRHNFSAAFSYDLPRVFKNRLARVVLDNWGLDDRFSARTGFPVNLAGPLSFDPVTGNQISSGLNIVPGVPVYVTGSQYPGGRAINANAFAVPAAGEFGDAPRNFARGFGAWQMDLAVRREFPIHEHFKLQFRAEAFNVFNHPNFGRIEPFIGNPNFGQATQTLNVSLGTVSPLYQMGGPRSMQFALKLLF
jgi:hypothetical protein